MTLTRREFFAASAAGTASVASAEPAARVGMGVLLYSYGIRARQEKGFAEPASFAAFCRERGAAGVQVPLGTRDETSAKKLRDRLDELGLYLEGIVRPPTDEKDAHRFEAEIRAAGSCGAGIVRTVLSPGRRYEVFSSAGEYPRFTARAEKTLAIAEPILKKHKVKLAVENHKDYRAEELAALMKRFSSEYIGVCLDTGNNIALLDEPAATARVLAPWTFTVHLKDMCAEESKDGFQLAEVPLGQGRLDLKSIIGVVRKANPAVRFNLEMITRDPLAIPCLTDRYWATLGKVPGFDLARMLAWVRAGERKEPLPRIAKLPIEEQLRIEDRHVRESFEFAAREKLFE